MAFLNSCFCASTVSKSTKSLPLSTDSSFTQNNLFKTSVRYDGVTIVSNYSARPKISIPELSESKIHIWKTSKSPDADHNFDRFAYSNFNKPSTEIDNLIAPSSDFSIRIRRFRKKQKVLGFGGALTDAVVINLQSLKESGLDQEVFDAYFGETSAEYSIVRTPIASCDFSVRKYTYLDTRNDFDLKTFALQPEDDPRIEFLKKVKLAQKNVEFMASSWSPPIWMKSNEKFTGKSKLKGSPGDKYHKTWAKYLVRFLQEYHKRGVNFSYMTTQNEPTNGGVIPANWQSLGWSAGHMRDWLKTDFGPEFKNSAFWASVKMIMLDDVKIWLPFRADTVLAEPDNDDLIKGVGLHWYMNYVPDIPLFPAICNILNIFASYLYKNLSYY